MNRLTLNKMIASKLLPYEMNVKFVISKPLCDRYTFSNEYFLSNSTGFHTPSQLVTVQLKACALPYSVSSLQVYRHQKTKYVIASDILLESSNRKYPFYGQFVQYLQKICSLKNDDCFRRNCKHLESTSEGVSEHKFPFADPTATEKNSSIEVIFCRI